MVESAVVVDEELGFERGVGGGLEAVGHRVGDGEGGGSLGEGDFDDGEDRGLAGGEAGDGAESGGVEALGAADAVVDGEEDCGEGRDG